MGKLKDQIKNWWHGEDVIVDGYIGVIKCQPHWTARIIQSIFRYTKRHQSWIIPMIVAAAVAIYIAFKFQSSTP